MARDRPSGPATREAGICHYCRYCHKPSHFHALGAELLSEDYQKEVIYLLLLGKRERERPPVTIGQ